MLDGMVSTMAPPLPTTAARRYPPTLWAPRSPPSSPTAPFPTADRDIAIAIGSEKLWAVFCQAIERADLAGHPDYSTNAARVRNRAVLEPLLAGIFRSRTGAGWVRILGALGIPCALVQTIPEVFASPQMAARRMFPECNGFPITGPPLKFSDTPGSPGQAAPHLGEHTRSVLSSLLGLSATEMDRLQAAGVIR